MLNQNYGYRMAVSFQFQSYMWATIVLKYAQKILANTGKLIIAL